MAITCLSLFPFSSSPTSSTSTRDESDATIVTPLILQALLDYRRRPEAARTLRARKARA
jgi:hypothetical protein